MELKSICPFDCPDACGLLVRVEDGRAVKVRGDPDHPYSKGEAAFRRATWDEAIALVAGRFRAVVAEHGSEAILPYSYAGSMGIVQRNAGMAFFHALGATRLERTICTPAQEIAWRTVMGDTPGPSPDEAVDSDLVVLWGINAVATNIHFVQRVKEARRRGARVLLLETHRNDTAPIADEVVLVRPGSDGALALAMIHVLDREGLADEAFLARESTGWPELRARARAFGPAEASPVVGLPAGEIERLARTLARARAPFVRMGGGPSRHGNGAMNVRLVIALTAALGAFARKGGGCFLSTNSSLAFDLSPWLREDLLPRRTRSVTMNELGRALAELGDPPVKAMYVWCSNPAAVAPDQNAVLRGLSREDLFLAVHERFMTDTARYADVVLPATSSLEHADLYRSYGQYTVQRVKAAVPPLGEAKPNWEVFRLLARAMGLDAPLFSLDAEAVIDLVLDASRATRPAWWDGVDRAALDRGEAVELRPPRAAGWGTASGKIELVSPGHAEPVPRHLPSHSDREPDPLPLRLVTAPALNTLNSTFQERPELRARNGEMAIHLAPAEAARRGLADGARVVAWNGLGEAVFALRVDAGVPEGVAVAPGVHWLEHTPGGRNVNALTSQRLTDDGKGSTFYDNRVDVRAG